MRKLRKLRIAEKRIRFAATDVLSWGEMILWIEKKQKKFYDDSVLQGVRLHFAKNISTEIRESCKDFCRWLRRNYFFPIRCNIIIKNCSYFEGDKDIAGDKDSYADFYYDSGEKEDYPEIWIAAGRSKGENAEKRKKRLLFLIAHELTHYFQWYFYEIDNRSDRSLEIEANKWSRYLLQEYFNTQS